MEQITIQEVKKDCNLMDEFIEQNLGLVWAVINKHVKISPYSIYDPEDLFQLGCIGLFKAATRFDDSYGCQFSTYAFPIIRGEITGRYRDYGMTTLKTGRQIKDIFFNYLNYKDGDLSIEEIAKKIGVTTDKLLEAIGAFKKVYSLEAPINAGHEDELNLENFVGSYEFESNLLRNMIVKEVMSKIEDYVGRKKYKIYLMHLDGYNQESVAERFSVNQTYVSRAVSDINNKVIPKIIKQHLGEI